MRNYLPLPFVPCHQGGENNLSEGKGGSVNEEIPPPPFCPLPPREGNFKEKLLPRPSQQMMLSDID
jgi:hypothetical protein